ncbi:hypothetical protein RRG08_049516 [Elysia crispata]|uniref:Uncharacterized protein n=1 Tax=Elysia crispata TaxID=231223 RepID=A0AAE0ZER3_9GAST|nr:hypothetical protein RRG08_049516 [Elysia crispata]
MGLVNSVLTVDYAGRSLRWDYRQGVSYHSYRQVPQLSSGTTVAVRYHSYREVPQLPYESYRQVPQLPSGTTVTVRYHSYRQVSQLSSGTTVTGRHHSYRQVPQLPSGTTVTVMYHRYRQVPHISSCTTVTVMYHICRHIPQLPSYTTVAFKYHSCRQQAPERCGTWLPGETQKVSPLFLDINGLEPNIHGGSIDSVVFNSYCVSAIAGFELVETGDGGLAVEPGVLVGESSG